MQYFRPTRLQYSNVLYLSFDLFYSCFHNFCEVILSNVRKIEVLCEAAVLAHSSFSILLEDAAYHFALLLLFCLSEPVVGICFIRADVLAVAHLDI